jgi:Na+-transporting methylmalonyl-CoA/oxaloacetate decarboxylase gamma subunit
VSILLLLAIQAAGQEVTTFYPLPSKAQQQKELKQAQDLPAGAPAPAAASATKPQEPKVAPKPEAPIEVVSVKTVPANANVIFVPGTQKPR